MDYSLLQNYCSASIELSGLKTKTADELREIRSTRKAAERLLLEMQKDGEVIARLSDDEGCFSVKVKTQYKRKSEGLGVLQKIHELWLNGDVYEMIRPAVEDVTLDPIDFFVDKVVENVWSPAVEKRSILIKPVKENSLRVQDLPQITSSSLKLVSSVVAAKAFIDDRSSEVKKERKELKNKCSSIEGKLISDLANFPQEQQIHKVDLLCKTTGQEDSFYVRLKQARKLPVRKVSADKIKKALKELLSEKAQVMKRDEVLQRLVDPQIGRTLYSDLSARFSESGEEEPTLRIAVDHFSRK